MRKCGQHSHKTLSYLVSGHLLYIAEREIKEPCQSFSNQHIEPHSFTKKTC